MSNQGTKAVKVMSRDNTSFALMRQNTFAMQGQ